MKIRRFRLEAVTLSLLFCFPILTAHSQSRLIASGGTTTPQAAPLGVNADGQLEIDSALSGDADAGNDATGFTTLNRKMGHGRHGHGDRAEHRRDREDHDAVKATFDGLNFHDQRFANNGNQFSVEPPDQGLCAGNGFVLESANDVLRIFDMKGNPLIGVVDLNTFYGYPAAVNRTTSPVTFGPSITDPSCHFDRETQRWFHVVLTLDRAVPTSQALSGKNHLDLAVSNTPNPLGEWTIYRIPVQDDGTDGTPNHGCILDPQKNTTGPCLGDYPHIGADSNGIYLTTNEFSLFGPGFIGAQIYAISKDALATKDASIPIFQYNTGDVNFASATGLPGFAVIPAISPGRSEDDGDGTEYFLSSTAVFADSGVDSRVQLWALTDTHNLARHKAPILLNNAVSTESYGIPNPARQPGVGTDGIGQKPGGGNIDWPQGQCLNDPNCAPILIGVADPFTEVISPLDGDDSRMTQVYFADGKVWGSLGTGVSFDGKTFGSDGIAYFIIKPKTTDKLLSGKVLNQGYVATPKGDLTYPTFGVTSEGKAILSFTLTGPNDFPSLAYVKLNQAHGAGDIHIAAHGIGAQDGFTGYKGQVGDPTRPRWGDYGATAVVGSEIFAAQEYIGQSCSLPEYRTSSPFGTCNDTRGALGNWGTRVMRLSTDKNDD
ncbi:MAG TPA: hypothetical protein VK638_12705 [Edaphobacter sp.]|nr:hypothetical protein [Edaphobacter sp.]